MPRGKRQSDDEQPRPASAKRGRVPTNSTRRTLRHEAPPPPVFSQKLCIRWYQEYVMNDDEGVLGPEGMERFCNELGVDPADVVMLVLAWKMSAKQMGYFTLQEWIRGMTELECDSKTKLHDKLDFLRSLLKDPALFKSIYRYAFDFAKDKDQRSMDVETSKAMLRLLLADQWSLFLHFVSFLDDSKYRVINKDQWANILEFARSINDDLSNYDVDGAWPVMLDEFVDWLKKVRDNEAATKAPVAHSSKQKFNS